MKIAIVSCFDYVKNRLVFIKNEFEAEGHVCEIYMSDFFHHKKRYYKDAEKYADVRYVHAKRYKKNLSVGRLLSHRKWAKDVYALLIEERPDAVYALLPPNSIAKYMAKYKEKYGCQLFLDVLDMWPESFAKGGSRLRQLLKLPFSVWRNERNKALEQADKIYTECALYQELLKNQGIKNAEFTTRYLIGPRLRQDRVYMPEADSINLCYLGSINHIIDIPKIVEIAKAIHAWKRVRVHIIGRGESKEFFIQALSEAGIKVTDYGAIYDEEKKQQIMNHCDFAINIMKDSVAVGVTTKSVDYLWAGVPLLNTIKFDTAQLVQKYRMGYNISTDTIEATAKEIAALTEEQKQEMRKNATKCYLENFSPESTEKAHICAEGV